MFKKKKSLNHLNEYEDLFIFNTQPNFKVGLYHQKDLKPTGFNEFCATINERKKEKESN
jgi:hypothetical protein